MNSNLRFSKVFRVCGWLLLLEASFMVLPAVVSLCYGEDDWWTFLLSGAAAAGAGGASAYMFRKSPARLNRQDAMLLTTLVWILFSFFGMLPFITGPLHADAASAFFETMSGLTTTGATVITDVEAQTHGLLFWRALIQWIGGLGIVLFILAVLPALNQDGGISMFNAEMTGISHDKLHPRIRQTAKSLWEIYTLLTLALMLLLIPSSMNGFDIVCQSLTTLSTGGFSTSNSSIAGFNSPYAASVITVFMLLGGVNFSLLYCLIRGKWRLLRTNTVLKTYIGVVISIYLLILLSLILQGKATDADSALLQPFFLIASAITTTGFSYGDFSAWGTPTLALVLLMMLTGACAGSTTGAVKIDRLTALFKHVRGQTMLSIYPHRIARVNLNGKPLEDGRMSRITAFIAIYISLIAAATLTVCFCGFSFTDSLFAVTSCIGNNGLGYGATAGSFMPMPAGIKWMLSALMLTGRLEIFTVAAILIPAFWRR